VRNFAHDVIGRLGQDHAPVVNHPADEFAVLGRELLRFGRFQFCLLLALLDQAGNNPAE
jgi:hypothetical protein